MHCQHVRSNQPWTEPEIDRFLLLPMEDIIAMFCNAVKQMVATSPAPLTTSPAPTTSSPSLPLLSAPLPMTDIPPCPFTFPPEDICRCVPYSDSQFLWMAQMLKNVPNQKKGPIKTFLSEMATDLIASLIKQYVLSEAAKLPPAQQK